MTTINLTHAHKYGPWVRVDATGGKPVSRDDSAWVAYRRRCACGSFEHRNKENADADAGPGRLAACDVAGITVVGS